MERLNELTDSPPKRLKKRKTFKPLPKEAGEEFYPNGIFEFNVTKLSIFIEENPDQFQVEQVEVQGLGSGSYEHLNKKVVSKADLTNPIILAEISPDRYNVIDGNHRVAKAVKEGVQHLPAYRVRVHQHIAFLTSVQAYEEYTEYWNTKVRNINRIERCHRKNLGI